LPKAEAVNEPGTISKAYLQFCTYSFGNQLLAWAQCVQRGIAHGPLATFPRWRELSRYVRKGEKALMLCHPVTFIHFEDRHFNPDVVTDLETLLYQPQADWPTTNT
jgi:hypothetical protein